MRMSLMVDKSEGKYSNASVCAIMHACIDNITTHPSPLIVNYRISRPLPLLGEERTLLSWLQTGMPGYQRGPTKQVQKLNIALNMKCTLSSVTHTTAAAVPEQAILHVSHCLVCPTTTQQPMLVKLCNQIA